MDEQQERRSEEAIGDLELDADEAAKVTGGAAPDVSLRPPVTGGPVPIPYPNVPPDPPAKK